MIRKSIVLTLISLKLKTSVVNVEFTTDGLFLTLGNIMPPLRDIGFVLLLDVVADAVTLMLLCVVDVEDDDDDDDVVGTLLPVVGE